MGDTAPGSNTTVLGISCFYHDSGAAIVRGGRVLSACQEERFSRVKHDANFPARATRACLATAGLSPSDIDAVALYEMPDVKLERIVDQFASHAPRGWSNFRAAMDQWIDVKMWMEDHVRTQVPFEGPIRFVPHHLSHAASAFYPSPYRSAAIVTVDGVGEWTTTAWGRGEDNEVRMMAETVYPHSLGLLYSAFTYYCGFRVNSGEYKLMGLAAYGKPRYADVLRQNLIDLRTDGSFELNMRYFDFDVGSLTVNQRFEKLLGGPPRKPDEPPRQREMDLAASIQEVLEEALLAIARHVYQATRERYLVLAGGVALNCVANTRILSEGPFEGIWIQPAAGDAGGSLGAALEVFYRETNDPRKVDGKRDSMAGAFLGPSFEDRDVRIFVRDRRLPVARLEDERLFPAVAQWLDEGHIVGWFSGRMEWGPRALGNRSILADARNPTMQSRLNRLIKFRESFRPFAPIVLEEFASSYFETKAPSPYMTLVADVAERRRKPLPPNYDALMGLDKLGVARSEIPAVTHVDFSARLQTIGADTNPRMARLLWAFYERTGCPVLINTSFNQRGEPIVSTPATAYDCFMRTGIDVLVLENWVFEKGQQPMHAPRGAFGAD